MIGQHEIHHRFHHWNGPGQNAGVVSPFGGKGGGFATVVDGLLLLADRCGWFEGHADHDRLTIADSSLDSPGIVGGRAQPSVITGEKSVIVLAPFEQGAREA